MSEAPKAPTVLTLALQLDPSQLEQLARVNCGILDHLKWCKDPDCAYTGAHQLVRTLMMNALCGLAALNETSPETEAIRLGLVPENTTKEDLTGVIAH